MVHYANLNKTQQKTLKRYKDYLNITTDGELFVLEHILRRDWGRDILLQSIETIKFNDVGYPNLVHVVCSTRSYSYNFSVSHLGTSSNKTSLEEQKRYIDGDLYHKIRK
jgi:hypothetical protein